ELEDRSEPFGLNTEPVAAGSPGHREHDADPGSEAGRLRERRLLAIGALEEGTLAGVDVVHAFARIDDTVYETMGHLAGAQIESVADLHQAISEWPSHGLFTAMTGLPD